MKLATIRETRGAGTRAVRVDGAEAVVLDAADVGAVLRREGWRAWAETADGPRRAVDGLDYAPLIPAPDKIICVGLNYHDHIAETGASTPEHPTLFAKFRGSLVGANDDVILPSASSQVDYEAELAVIIGARIRHGSTDQALAAIAGYAVMNDVSMRDFQYRTPQWLQGKTWEQSTPLGPWLVTADESPGPSREISCEVAGELLQKGDTDDLVFDPVAIVAYISTIVTLEPGDVISTGTPSGVGVARNPQRFLEDGEVMVTRVSGLGECRNRCRQEP